MTAERTEGIDVGRSPNDNWQHVGATATGYCRAASAARECVEAALAQQTSKSWKLRLPLPSNLAALPDAEALKVALAMHATEFLDDAEELEGRLDVAVDPDSVLLGVTAETEERVAELIEALYGLLASDRAFSRRNPAWRQPWVVGSVTIASATVALSLLPNSLPGVLLLAGVVAGLAAGALIMARRRRSEILPTALRLAPLLVMVTFAIVYSAAELGGSIISPDSTVGGAHLRDPLLLSLQAMVTGGFGDLAATGWVRTVVYLEMLLLWGLVAAAVVAAARRFDRVDAALASLRRPEDATEGR